ncbi:testis-specific serine/threonine-protein kinase 3-like isoform X2 [Amblyomma americanum]
MAALWSQSHLPCDYAQETTDAYVLAKNGYTLGAEIGSGSYSTVMMVEKDNVAYACKIVNMAKTSSEYRTRFLPREINIMARLRHPNITRVFQMICEAKKVFIVMELATGGDLLSKIQSAGRLDERTAHHIFVQLASAVAYLHRRNIAHRDLKCDNVLLTTQQAVKLADFSFSRYCNDPVERKKMVLSETYCGSEAYAPPEVLQGVPYYPKQSDMWSLGIILYVMMTGAMPFQDGNIVRQVGLQMNRVIRFPLYVKCTHQYRNLVYLLLEPVTTLRATMKMVVRHPWLFLFPDPTNTLTQELDWRAKSSELHDPLLVSDRHLVQPKASRAASALDEHGVTLPALDRKAAAESLRNDTTAGRTGGRTFGQQELIAADLPENFEGLSFEEDGVRSISTGQENSEEDLFSETTTTTTTSDDLEVPEEEETSPPSEQPPVERKCGDVHRPPDYERANARPGKQAKTEFHRSLRLFRTASRRSARPVCRTTAAALPYLLSR